MRDNSDLVNVCLAMLLFLGLSFPSSFGGELTPALDGVLSILILVIYACIIGFSNLVPLRMLIISLAIPSVYALSTLVSGLPELRPGSLVYYLTAAAMYSLNLREVTLSSRTQTLFLFANSACIILGIELVLGNDFCKNLILNHYAAYRSDLLPVMLDQHKPVLVFATHSFAAFMIYCFFLLTWRSYLAGLGRIYLILALCNFGLIVCLLSFTAVLFTVVATVQILLYGLKRHRKLTVTLVCAGLLSIPYIITQVQDELGGIGIGQGIDLVLNFEASGPTARFGPQGTLTRTFNYIKAHPLSPIGMSYFPDVTYGDSGPIEYILRGSIPLLVLMYGGYFLFLKNNLKSRRDFRLFFLVTMLFEIGFPVLVQLRFVALIPVFIAYLNHLNDLKTAPPLIDSSSPRPRPSPHSRLSDVRQMPQSR